ncbi:MAG: (Fe-S)-binding protein [Candidatus Thorarchaeota archaeon]|jgi:heterodisulfide reductase subunit D
MVDLKKFEGSGHETDPYICASCGNCTMVCPTFRLMRWESYGPRGRLQITKAILEGEQELDEEYVRKLFLCSLCEHCSQVCTTSIQLDRFWELVREIAWDSDLVPAPVEYACKSIMKNGDPFSLGASSRMLWTEGLDIDIQDRIEKPAKTAYFVGCNVSLKPRSHKTAQSVIRILEHSGTDYTLLGEKEICCGGPLIWGGNKKHASAMAERNIWLFRELGVERIIFSCPSCIHSWPKTYKEAAGVPIQREFELMTLSQFIDSLIRRKALKFQPQSNITVTYHDPCISSRRLKVINEPREVIEKIPGVYNIDMLHSKEDTRCCGAHGLVNLTDPLVASQIAELRLRDVSVMPASRVITECPRCIQALDLATQTMQYSVQVQDISELVAESLIEEEGGENA